jgi:hypothetical protein
MSAVFDERFRNQSSAPPFPKGRSEAIKLTRQNQRAKTAPRKHQSPKDSIHIARQYQFEHEVIGRVCEAEANSSLDRPRFAVVVKDPK